MANVSSGGAPVDLVPEVRDFFLGSFTRTVSEITAKAHLLPHIQAIANDDEILQGLVERMRRGSKSDVRAYVDEVFDLFPFGLRTSVVYSLTEIFREWQQHQRATKRQRKNDVAELFSHEVCGDLVKKWKSGTFTPSELYAGISSAVVNGSMEPQLAKRMVDLTLQDAGYFRTNNDRADFDQTKRFRADAKGFDLVNLQSVAASLDGSEIEMLTYGGTSTTVSSTKHTVVSKCYPSSYNMTTKGKQLWWRHEGGGDQLFFLQPESASSRPLLLIGGSLKLENGDLDIEVVIGVDVCPHASSDDTLSASILVDGQWLGELDRSTRGMCDGASEVGGDDDNDNNSVGSGDEDESPRVGRSLGATQTVKRRYYCIFVTIINGTVIVRYVTPIHKSLALDQHPTLILSLRPSLVVVGGTNGLLGLVDASVFSLYSSASTQSAYQSSDNYNESCNSPLSDTFDPLRPSVISNLSDLGSRVRIGSVITLKGGQIPSFTTLQLPGRLNNNGGDEFLGDEDSITTESVRGDAQALSLTPLTADSFSKEFLQPSLHDPSRQEPGPRIPQHQQFSTNVINLVRRTPLSRMNDSFSSPGNNYTNTHTHQQQSHSIDQTDINNNNEYENKNENGNENENNRRNEDDDSSPSNDPEDPRYFTPRKGDTIVTHAADSCITALSYSGEESCVFASGDNSGILCLWHVIDDNISNINSGGKWNTEEIKDCQSRKVKLAALPLQMASGADTCSGGVGGGIGMGVGVGVERGEQQKVSPGTRINSLFMSSSGRHVAVGLWDRLLLVALGQDENRDPDQSTRADTCSDSDRDSRNYHRKYDSPTRTLPPLYVRNSLDIVTGCRAVYSVVFRSPQLHVWRLTNTPLAHPFSPSKVKVVIPQGQSTGTGPRVILTRDSRPTSRTRGVSTRDREFRFFPDILRRSATPSTSTTRSSSIFSVSSPSSPVSRRRFSVSSAPSTPIPLDLPSPSATLIPPSWASVTQSDISSTSFSRHSWLGAGQNRQGNPHDKSSTDRDKDDGGEERGEEKPVGVTVTSWLHPNVDCFDTRFGMSWNDATIFKGCFSEADDAGEVHLIWLQLTT